MASLPADSLHGLLDLPVDRLHELDGEFDLAIVGGGIIGAGIARDAALRGLRYLETLDSRLVRIDLRERELLLRNARHLVRPLSFLPPF